MCIRDRLSRVRSLELEVECLIHNAGCGRCFLPHEFPEDEFDKIFDLNVKVPFALNKMFLPEMLERESGKIVFIGSSVTSNVVGRDCAYSASKAAALKLMEGLAKDYSRYGVISCAISPHFVEGQMMDRSIRGYATHKGLSFSDAKKVFEGKMPQKKFVKAEEIAEMVVVFCSGKVPSLSGEEVKMFGGGI